MSMLEVEVPRASVDADATLPQQKEDVPPTRDVRHEYTRSLPPLLSQLRASLLVSTDQAGKVPAVAVAAVPRKRERRRFGQAPQMTLRNLIIAAIAIALLRYFDWRATGIRARVSDLVQCPRCGQTILKDARAEHAPYCY